MPLITGWVEEQEWSFFPQDYENKQITESEEHFWAWQALFSAPQV